MYDFNVNLYGKMEVTVVAESREEAERILNDTIESITIKEIRDKLSPNKDVEINKSHISYINNLQKDKERGVDR